MICIPTLKDCELAMYADDTAIYCESTWKNINIIKKRLSEALKNVSQFFKNWKIKLNESKTEAIVFTKSGNMIKKLNQNPLPFEGNLLPWKESVTYLGVVLDQKLSFRPHIDKMIAKARGMVSCLYCLLRKNNSVPIDTKISIYRAIVRPIMTYACPVFNNCPVTHFRRLQIQQNKVLRMATNAPWFTRNDDMHDETNIPFIRDFIDKLTESFYDRANSHDNHLIKTLGAYSKNSIGFRVKHRLPKKI